MKKINFFLIVLFIVLIVSNCEYFKLLSKNEWEEISDQDDSVIIYVSGAIMEGTDVVPCYWKIKDDKIEQIDLEYVLGTNNSIAYSIYILGDDVYACGHYDNGTTARACYWINEKRYDLEVDDPASASYSFSIKENNGVVFVAGVADGKANYWINQNKNVLNIDTAKTIYIRQLSSSKHDIYIGGINLKNPSQACYWKNGYIVDLPPLPVIIVDSSEVWSIQVVGNIVYSAGTKIINSIQDACLWKNQDLTVLPNGAYGFSVAVLNGDTYVAGQSSVSTACYWKNNKFRSLPYSSAPSIAYGIFIYNNVTYIAGYDNNGGTQQACYWVNEDQEHLNDAVGVISQSYSIFVTTDNDK